MNFHQHWRNTAFVLVFLASPLANAGSPFEGAWSGYTDGPFNEKTRKDAAFELWTDTSGKLTGTVILSGTYEGKVTQISIVGKTLQIVASFDVGTSTVFTVKMQADGSLAGTWRQQGKYTGTIVLQRHVD